MTILYLHGLNSSGGSAKAARLRGGLAPIEVLAPTYPAHRPRQAVERLGALLATLPTRQLVVVGSSMGGFYGQYLARRFPFGHLVLINPALRPWELLPDHVGPQFNPATGEHYQLSEREILETRPFGVETVADGIPTTLFLDRGDEVIDYRIAEALYRGIGELHLFDGGSHAFDHMTEAVERIRALHQGVAAITP
jgi:uncharacterized protein